MSYYLYLGSYTAAGRAGLMAEGGSQREKEVRALCERLGGRVHQYLFSLAEFDFMIVVEFGSDSTAVAPALLASATGTVNVRAIKLLTPTQMDEACAQARAMKFRAAGAS